MRYTNPRAGSHVNLRALGKFGLLLAGLILVYSLLFHVIMEYEGREESWATGLYWTLTVMSTLGFGDITFQSDLGRLFSTLVLVTGIIFLLILLPFTFIEFFYEPWMKAQQAARAPTRLLGKVSGHVILVHFDDVTRTLIEKLRQYKYPYVLILPNVEDALRLHDFDYRVMLGELDNPQTYELAQVQHALAVVATASDQINANVAATVREVSSTVKIISTADAAASVDILELAGSNSALQLGERMGQALARRAVDGDALAHVIGQFGKLLIAEAMARGTELVGKTLRESGLRETAGIHVLGFWDRGAFQAADADTIINDKTVLVMAGLDEHITRFNALYDAVPPLDVPLLIIGGGRVGQATGDALEARGVDYRIIEKQQFRVSNRDKFVFGDAAEIEVLEEAGIRQAPAVVITTHDDDMNIYLTIYCRKLRPDIQIISRAGLERNVATLHRAGADFVMSYAATGANAILNLLGRDNILMVAEGLDVFEVDVPQSLAGKTIAEAEIHAKTGATVVAIRDGTSIQVTLDPSQALDPGSRVILVGTPAAEGAFLNLYKNVKG
jgi:Trk K+ transport system NAD-binding subunit